MQLQLSRGPYDGVPVQSDNPSDVVGLPIDEHLNPSSAASPFALALYKRAGDSTPSDYGFVGVQATNQNALLITVSGGPVAGKRQPSPPSGHFPTQLVFAIGQDGQEFDNTGEVVAVAIYELTAVDGKWNYCFVRLEESGENVDLVRREVQVRRAKEAANNFYHTPNYAAYEKTPTGEHKQVFVQHGHRQAHVDEKLADLIVELWKRDLDTIGSCQQRESGMAYLSFPVPGHGEVFHQVLKEADIESSLKPKQMRIKDADTGDTHTIDTSHVYFAPDAIEAIVSLFRSGPSESTC